MNTAEKIALAKEILSKDKPACDDFKIIKKDQGLIERAEGTRTILTEDNKELLID